MPRHHNNYGVMQPPPPTAPATWPPTRENQSSRFPSANLQTNLLFLLLLHADGAVTSSGSALRLYRVHFLRLNLFHVYDRERSH